MVRRRKEKKTSGEVSASKGEMMKKETAEGKVRIVPARIQAA